MMAVVMEVPHTPKTSSSSSTHTLTQPPTPHLHDPLPEIMAPGDPTCDTHPVNWTQRQHCLGWAMATPLFLLMALNNIPHILHLFTTTDSPDGKPALQQQRHIKQKQSKEGWKDTWGKNEVLVCDETVNNRMTSVQKNQGMCSDAHQMNQWTRTPGPVETEEPSMLAFITGSLDCVMWFTPQSSKLCLLCCHRN